MANEVANNALFAIFQYSYAQEIRTKISWVWTAITLLKAYIESDRLRKELEEAERVVEETFDSVNWDCFEVYRRGDFNLITDEEYAEIIQKLKDLEKAKNTVLKVMIEAGLTDARFPKAF